MELRLGDGERQQGAHYTPPSLAERVVELARPSGATVDPACGAGALLLAAAGRLPGERDVVARDLLWGADIDPLAVAVTEAAIALWSGGVAPAPGHLVVADTLLAGRSAWTDPPPFTAVVGNPPFQNQLAAATARPSARQHALRERYGDAVTPYVDTAALFLLLGVELAAPGGQVAMVQPQSTVASRDAGPVRAALAEGARLVDLWVASEHVFAARVHVCVPALAVGVADPGPDWIGRLAGARGVPEIDLHGPPVGSVATAVAGFRQHYYALVDHVREGAAEHAGALVTSGCIGIGSSSWGRRPVRFAKRTWDRPVVDVEDVSLPDGWLERVSRPKVLVASQTRVIEAVADIAGSWIPVTPVVSVVPADAADVHRIAAALCAPPVAVWAARQASGTGLSPTAIRMSASLTLGAPLPPDRRSWERASAALEDGDLASFAEHATAMHGLPTATADEVLAWWHASRPESGVGPPPPSQ
jgi:hypothetical protein